VSGAAEGLGASLAASDLLDGDGLRRRGLGTVAVPLTAARCGAVDGSGVARVVVGGKQWAVPWGSPAATAPSSVCMHSEMPSSSWIVSGTPW
jgi:hypothetical protein